MLFPKKLQEQCHFANSPQEVDKELNTTKMLLPKLGWTLGFDLNQWVKNKRNVN
jgi:hypothetical protein